MDFLEKLNKEQLDAVTYCDGAQLVIAGAGSGKTRVLTCKIAYLLRQAIYGLKPWNILALTFTNKAAKEMKQRISLLVGEQLARGIYMGTFHSIFAYILRVNSEKLGYTSDYTIYDDVDSRSMLSTIIKELALSDKEYKPVSVLHRISMAKNRLILADDYASNQTLRLQDAQMHMPEIYRIYQHYQQRCHTANAMDFDDLLTNTWKLFRLYPEICNTYANRFRYILVDEYQDTNFVQQQILYLLAKEHQHICVVGDDAQSIYAFRGANIDYILDFDRLYPHAKTFKLEQNYRSTQNIVDAANSLIGHNQRQIRKNVFSRNDKGDKLCVQESYSDRLEAIYVCDNIQHLQKRTSIHSSYNNYAILYRTNAQSRLFEEELHRRGIPYKIYGGLSFYQRKEIKDILAYFRVVVNPNDEEALKRIINYPLRGIGNTTYQKIIQVATDYHVSSWSVIASPHEYNLPVSKGVLAKLRSFTAMIQSFQSRLYQLTASDLAEFIIHNSGVYNEIFNDKSPEGMVRQENVSELMNELHIYVEDRNEIDDHEDLGLNSFLQEVSLLSEIDSDNDSKENGEVTLMTIHAAKGLEFPVVFIVGLEENIFPSQKSCSNLRMLEEERRLLYVAITRAKSKCFLSYAKTRYRYGKTEYEVPSRFLKDIDNQYLKQDNTHTDDSNCLSIERQSAFHLRKLSSLQEKEANMDTPAVYWKRNAREDVSSQEKRANTAMQLKTGMFIEHSRFGRGKVINIVGTDDDTKATVFFGEKIGTKQLLLKFAHFSIV